MYCSGQRWISQTEPELGLGTVMEATSSRVQILFPASGEMRHYARENAPLQRVRFRVGDTIQSDDDQSWVVREVRERQGLIYYAGSEGELPESRLSDRISFHGPRERILAGQVDACEDFGLRVRALDFLHRTRQSDVRGFVGGRIDLIPHQLSIAHEVSHRPVPRVLLSDEVGLGKTIEACLVVHRLLLSGRAARVLIVVPESLVHQWFVEMLRKFNVWLHIFDEERCASIEAGQPDANPFLDDQCVLCSLQFLIRSEKRAAQALAAGWDVLVVDEAHHLQWSPAQASVEYKLVEALSREVEGLLLLTATPEQLGPESHYARLRLLDPDRYQNYAAFARESASFPPLASLVERLRAGEPLNARDIAYLHRTYPREKERWNQSARSFKNTGTDAAARTALIDHLLDLHGPGRVVFRNTRAAMKGFPIRRPHLVRLQPGKNRELLMDRLSTEFAQDAGDESLAGSLDWMDDPRVIWLAEFLGRLAPQKVLLICRTPEKAMAVDAALRQKIQLKAGIFHEGLTLLQRDRNAAWFAGEEDVRLLICSEIGSEGRNFQFAHHLVLFDLPHNPELLEQRIGRLDRIGQTEDIHIHVPYVQGSPQEVLARWYHEGLRAFEHNLEGGHSLYRAFGRQIHDLALEFPVAKPAEAKRELAQLLDASSRARRELAERLEKGRDRLLEWNSFRPEIAQRLVETIGREDADPALEEFMLDVFEHFGVHAEELGPGNYHLNAAGVTTDAFPAIPEEGLLTTFRRAQALRREEVAFLTWDHPMVSGSMDLLLGSERGNSAFALWPQEGKPTLLLEIWFVLEAVAEGRWQVDRFLPATPIALWMDAKGRELSPPMDELAWRRMLRPGKAHPLWDNPQVSQQWLPEMLTRAENLAQQKAMAIRQTSENAMQTQLSQELDRLESLQKVNGHVRSEEVDWTRERQRQLTQAIRQSRLRLDAVLLIRKGPVQN